MTASRTDLPATAARRAADIRALLGPGGAAAALFAGYEARPGQLAMAERIADAIDGDERLLVEAGTGTGKTLAYLVPALLSGRKVVVSTGTKTLQDQIAQRRSAAAARDVRPGRPAARAARMGGDEGARNYVCRRRLARARPAAVAGRRAGARSRCCAFAASSQTGDRADLADLADDAPLWGEIAATPETRIGPRCAFYESCFVTAMRRRAAAAPLVIVNHHLFFADLALRARWPEAQVLPPYEVVIFDEAHQIEDVATEFFGVHASTQRLFALARDLGRETGVDAAARAGGRRRGCKAATDALADALRDLAARRRAPASTRRACRSPTISDPGPALRPLPRARRRASRRSRDWLDPDGDAVAALAAARPSWRASARRAAALRADLALLVDGPRPRARALAGRLAPQRQPARVARRRRRRCSGARSTPARARSCSRRRR